jgi:hypothetical protein
VNDTLGTRSRGEGTPSGPIYGPTPLAGAYAKLWGNYQTLASAFHRETATRARYEAALQWIADASPDVWARHKAREALADDGR